MILTIDNFREHFDKMEVFYRIIDNEIIECIPLRILNKHFYWLEESFKREGKLSNCIINIQGSYHSISYEIDNNEVVTTEKEAAQVLRKRLIAFVRRLVTQYKIENLEINDDDGHLEEEDEIKKNLMYF